MKTDYFMITKNKTIDFKPNLDFFMKQEIKMSISNKIIKFSQHQKCYEIIS